MAASMDVGFQMDQYVRQGRPNNTNLNPNSTSAHIPQVQPAMLSTHYGPTNHVQYGTVVSSNLHCDPSNTTNEYDATYMGSSIQMQNLQMAMQQQLQVQSQFQGNSGINKSLSSQSMPQYSHQPSSYQTPIQSNTNHQVLNQTGGTHTGFRPDQSSSINPSVSGHAHRHLQHQNPINASAVGDPTSNNQYTNVPTTSSRRDLTQSNFEQPSNQQVSSSSVQPAPRKRRGRPPIHPQPEPVGFAADDETTGLYACIRSGRVAPQSAVDDWIAQYKTDRDPAMMDLMQFFISSSGCSGKLTLDLYRQLDYANIVRRMTEEFDEDSGEYPLIQTSTVWKRFRVNFVEFIRVLVEQCQYSIIYDQCMIDQIMALLTAMTDSQVRAFRHTSTLATMKMMTALVNVALNVSINRDNNQRQYEAERHKLQQRRTSERLEMLVQRRQELDENMEEVKNCLVYFFKGVFVHRYRDIHPEIRGLCIQEIGVWMQRYPAMFLDDSYLKYVGWTLYDRVGDVRLHCLRALQPLYADASLVSSLQLFTSRFKSRLVDMTLDKEAEVAVQAVKLVCSILKHNQVALEDKDCENIYELVYCINRPLAQAAGEFLTLKLFEVGSHHHHRTQAASSSKTKKGKVRSESIPLLRDLVQFFIESELHEHASYLVDSLWDLNPMLRDWEAMLDLLLLEEGRGGDDTLDLGQETSLIEIMICCIRQAATGEPPDGRQSGGSHGGHGSHGPLPPREARALAEERMRMTEALISALPPLLNKYGESPERAANLLSIPRYMNLELYTTGRHERHLDLLLQAVQDLVERHTDQDVLLACSRVFEALCADELSIATKCHTVRGTLLDRLTEIYSSAFLSFFDCQGPADEFPLLCALKRIYAFFSLHDLSGLGLWDSFLRIAESDDRASPELLAQAVTCCYKTVLWEVARARESQSTTTEEADAISQLRSRIRSFATLCTGYLTSRSHKLASDAFLTICDLLIVLSPQLTTDQPADDDQPGRRHHLDSLVFTTQDDDLQTALTDYLERRVFAEDTTVDENDRLEIWHQNRTELAAFTKLIVYNVLPIRSAAPLYKYYIRSFNNYGDIMKFTLAKCREINRVQTARMIAHCLQLYYEDVQKSAGVPLRHGSDGLHSIKELSRRLNLSFGLDLVKIRESIITFHYDAIHYCVGAAAEAAAQSGQPAGVPPNLAFLEAAASEFSNKLLRQDKQSFLAYISRIFPNPVGDEWLSLHAYRSTLDSPGAASSAILPPTSETARPSTADQPSAQGRATTGEEADFIHPASIAPPPRTAGRGGSKRATDSSSSASTEAPALLTTPQLTSTAVKRRRVGDDIVLSPPQSDDNQRQQQSAAHQNPVNSIS